MKKEIPVLSVSVIRFSRMQGTQYIFTIWRIKGELIYCGAKKAPGPETREPSRQEQPLSTNR